MLNTGTPKNKLGILLSLFVIIIMGVVFIDVLGDIIYENRNIFSKTNESLSIATGSGTTAEDDIVAVSYFGNMTSDLTANLTTTINWTTAGAITVGASHAATDTYNISYTFEPDLYVSHGPSRTIISLVIIFFVIFILIVAVWGFNQIRDNWGT